jgi:hypothetical protein
LTFGVTICYEGFRYPETVRWAARRGAHIVFHPHFDEASPTPAGPRPSLIRPIPFTRKPSYVERRSIVGAAASPGAQGQSALSGTDSRQGDAHAIVPPLRAAAGDVTGDAQDGSDRDAGTGLAMVAGSYAMNPQTSY